tara:strand:+ start:171 stop:536 length:366 start_codon:yes stop_codon:yes gene_type:complete
MSNKKEVMSNNPHDPRPYFSKDWQNHNPWMEGIDDGYNGFDKTINELRCNLDKIKKDSEPKDTKRIGICINFVEGIPLDSFIEREKEKVAIIKKKLDDLTVFNDMMGEANGISRVVKSLNK